MAVEDTERGDISSVHKGNNASFHRIVNLEKPERSLLKSIILSQRCSPCTTPDWSSIFNNRADVGLGNACLLWEKVTSSSQDVKAVFFAMPVMCRAQVLTMEMPKRVVVFVGGSSLFMKKSGGWCCVRFLLIIVSSVLLALKVTHQLAAQESILCRSHMDLAAQESILCRSLWRLSAQGVLSHEFLMTM